jgi:hypothetical protein
MALKQSCQLLAKGITAGLSKLNKGVPVPDTDYLYHVLKHIRTTRCTYGSVMPEAQFKDEFGVTDGLGALKMEQKLLDLAEGDPLCLNNNSIAYVPANNNWITEPMKKQFAKWLKERREP